MLLHLSTSPTRLLDKCHDGVGILKCTEWLAEYQKPDAGFKFIHDNTVDPGVSIGEHTHESDEEVYIILGGRGEMLIDGALCQVSAGDVCVTRSGHSHSLTNTGATPMHMLVIGINIKPAPAS